MLVESLIFPYKVYGSAILKNYPPQVGRLCWMIGLITVVMYGQLYLADLGKASFRKEGGKEKGLSSK